MTTFLMRHHAPQQYGAWRDRMMFERTDPDGAMLLLVRALQPPAADCVSDSIGSPRRAQPPLRLEMPADEAADEIDRAAAARDERRAKEERGAF